ncbi:MAG: hypothetical protein JXB32_19270 [Deltaproteobacteria bacterium]|nr:hypothetical protein [Deltaproteobacteria bacterium]
MIFATALLVPAVGVSATRYVDGTASADTIRLGQVWVSADSSYHWYSCINGTWIDEGSWSSSDVVLVYAYGGDDIIEMQTATGYYSCGGTSKYLHVVDRGGCPSLIRTYLSTGADEFYGSNCGDEAYGGAGDDYLDGWVGSDVILGEAGNDVILGYSGQDWLEGGDNDDTIDGEGDADVVDGQGGSRDILYGGDGNDCVRDQADGYTTCDCGNGAADMEECTGATSNCEYAGCLSLRFRDDGTLESSPCQR